MPKTVPPGEITIGKQSFAANVLPDPFDERDLEYRPRIQPLPDTIDRRGTAGTVLNQVGNSCTGHAVAAVVNTINANKDGTRGKAKRSPRVSPYMLYRLARRYDEFPGEADAGSSLRGVFKGWFHHGVLLEETWPTLEMDREPDLDAADVRREAHEHPLGAFYRVNPFRLDDMQSAISELCAVAVSSVIHDGWAEPVEAKDPESGEVIRVIERRATSRSLGGHAYVLVGYNRVGFLVQNSWGARWGKGGFATLPYDEWLDSAYDAWVARPGVPQTPFAVGRTRTAEATGGELATAPGPDLRRLQAHVVNLANNGRLSQSGKFTSSPGQIHRAFENMQTWHDRWQQQGDPVRRVVLYAHGGVVGESAGLAIAQAQLNWWLNNHVYPLFFVWQSGPLETLSDFLSDRLRSLLPFRAAGFDILEAVDRLTEELSRSKLWWMWEEMKQNASLASEEIGSRADVQWPPARSAAINAMGELPGGSLVVDRLRRYADDQTDPVELHLVGHSAGSILLAALLERLRKAKLPVATLAFLGAAIRADTFERQVLSQTGPRRTVRRLANFVLQENVELDDTCAAGDFTFYNKSLLYLVARGFERPERGAPREVAVAGLFASLQSTIDRQPSLAQRISDAGGEVIAAPADGKPDARSGAHGHGEFDNDPDTMTSVVRRILGPRAKQASTYRPHAPLTQAATESVPAAGEATSTTARDQPFRAAAAKAPGDEPVQETAPDTDVPAPAAPGDAEWALEAADAPRSGSAVLDVLQAEGWEVPETQA